MSYDDPNRQAVGQPPIWTGAQLSASTYDPGEHTVADVLAYVESHPDDREAIAAAERSGKGRTTLLDALEPVEDDGT